MEANHEPEYCRSDEINTEEHHKLLTCMVALTMALRSTPGPLRESKLWKLIEEALEVCDGYADIKALKIPYHFWTFEFAGALNQVIEHFDLIRESLRQWEEEHGAP